MRQCRRLLCLMMRPLESSRGHQERLPPHASSRSVRTTHRYIAWLALMPLMIPVTAGAQPVPAPSWQQEYWARFDKRDWSAAIAAAENLVAAARPATPDTGLQLAQALTLLGNAHYGSGDLVAAEAAYRESLQLTDLYAGRSSAALIEPLRGLGYTLAAKGDHAGAVPYMDRALLLSRRSAGLFDLSQQGLLRQLANSLSIMGSKEDAESHMLYLLRVGEHAYGAGSPQMISLYSIVGRWYADIGHTAQARTSYRKAVSIAERTPGRADLSIVEPLRGLAQTYIDEVTLSNRGIPVYLDKVGTPVDSDGANDVVEIVNPRYLLSLDGERSLLRALATLEANADRSSRTLIETLVQTGDWFLIKQQPDKALPYYTRAAALIDSAAPDPVADDIDSAVALLKFPAQVYYPTPPMATRHLKRPAEETVDRFVQVEFTVLPDGSVKDERIVDHDSSERYRTQTLQAIRAARYRPRFVDGQAVETTAVAYRQIFRERKSSE